MAGMHRLDPSSVETRLLILLPEVVVVLEEVGLVGSRVLGPTVLAFEGMGGPILDGDWWWCGLDGVVDYAGMLRSELTGLGELVFPFDGGFGIIRAVAHGGARFSLASQLKGLVVGLEP